MRVAAGFNSIFGVIRGSFWGFRLLFGVKPGFPEVPSPLAGGYVYAVNNLLGIGQAAFVSAGV